MRSGRLLGPPPGAVKRLFNLAQPGHLLHLGLKAGPKDGQVHVGARQAEPGGVGPKRPHARARKGRQRGEKADHALDGGLAHCRLCAGRAEGLGKVEQLLVQRQLEGVSAKVGTRDAPRVRCGQLAGVAARRRLTGSRRFGDLLVRQQRDEVEGHWPAEGRCRRARSVGYEEGEFLLGSV